MEKKEMNVMVVSQCLIEKIKEFEGLRLEAYEDAAGVPTVGYGHTGDVVMGDRISEYWAEELLKEDLEQVEVAVNEMHVANTQGQFDALVSFAFNLGIRRLKHSRLLKCIRRGESRNEIKREFKRWIYAGGKPLNGLVKRREWEARRFFE
jgi:lysozyme